MERLEEIRKRSKGITGNMPDADKEEIHRRDCVALLSLIDRYKEKEVKPVFGESIISPLVLRLQTENQKYKTALERVYELDGYMFVKEALEDKEEAPE